MTQASICTIGDEILIGQIVDTNSARISAALGMSGIRCTRILSIGDSRNEIIDNLSNELKMNEIVITTGGLGPTRDDITKSALAELSGSSRYVEHREQLQIIYSLLHSRGLEVLDINKAQAMVPDTCEVIVNRLGTAPVMIFRFGAGSRFGHACTLYSLPGVPFEAMGALDEVIADIKAHNDISDIYHKTVMTFGMAESALSKKIEDWENNLPEDMHLAYLPNQITGVRLRLSIYGGEKAQEEARIDAEVEKLKHILGDMIYSFEDDNLQNTVGRLLRKTGKTVSVAESCTGGMISSLLTSIPGSSDYYLGSVTSYANSVKQNVLGVKAETLVRFGAVSSECVAEMAEGVRRITGSDYSVATSGIAGPGGGSEEKPVGLVWIGVASAKGVSTKKFIYQNDRQRNIERFSASALDILRKAIELDINN